MINLPQPQVFGTEARYSKHSERDHYMSERPFRAGVFKAQVKCCRNELKQNRLRIKSSLTSSAVFGTSDL